MDFGEIIKAAFDIITGRSDPFGEPKIPDVNDTKIMTELTRQHFSNKEKGETLGESTGSTAVIAKAIKSYMEDIDAPVATLAGDFAKEAEKYPITRKYPYLVAGLSIPETSGGKNVTFPNNPLNWGIYEPTFKPSSPQQVIERATSGIGERMPFYEDFRKSGDLQDFVSHYAPPTENDSAKYLLDLMKVMKDIKSYEQK